MNLRWDSAVLASPWLLLAQSDHPMKENRAYGGICQRTFHFPPFLISLLCRKESSSTSIVRRKCSASEVRLMSRSLRRVTC